MEESKPKPKLFSTKYSSSIFGAVTVFASKAMVPGIPTVAVVCFTILIGLYVICETAADITGMMYGRDQKTPPEIPPID